MNNSSKRGKVLNVANNVANILFHGSPSCSTFSWSCPYYLGICHTEPSPRWEIQRLHQHWPVGSKCLPLGKFIPTITLYIQNYIVKYVMCCIYPNSYHNNKPFLAFPRAFSAEQERKGCEGSECRDRRLHFPMTFLAQRCVINALGSISLPVKISVCARGTRSAVL